MRTKVTLVLLFLNVALFFFIFYLRPHWITDERLKEARRLVLGPETVNIRSLEISGAGAPVVRLVRHGEMWSLAQPLDWPANPHAISSILHTLQTLQHETSFPVADLAKNGQSLADYGLAKPSLTIAFTVGQGDAAPQARSLLRLGDTTKDGRRIYILSPDGRRVHVVDRALAECLVLPVEKLRSDALFSIPVFEVRSFNLQTAAPANLRIRLRHVGTRWSFETPIVARASKAATELAVNSLNALRVRSFVDQPPSDLSPVTNRTLSLTLEGNNRRETMHLGGVVAASAKSDAEVEYYGQIEGRSAFFTVAIPSELLRSLNNAQKELRDRRVFEFDAHAVTAIALRAPNSPELVLQRLETAAGDVASWQIVRRDGTQAPVTQLADSGAVQGLLERLGRLAAQEFLSDAPTSADLENWGFNSPQREISLTMPGGASLPAGQPPATATLKLGVGTDRGPHAYALDASRCVYQVDAEILRELPVDARAWRDRHLRELPAGARIAALKLVDVASKAVVFEKSFDGAAPADAELQPLLEQLRVLRARSFVADHFAPNVPVAGEERPWKYQLDVTVALAGGTGVQTNVYTLFFSDRLGGTTQYAGAKDLDAIFEVEQPLLDALWKITYGPQDPGPAALPQPEPAKSEPAAPTVPEKTNG